MGRAHIILDDGHEADILIREFTVNHSVCSEPEARIEGTLTRLSRRKLQVPELEVTRVIYNDPATIVYWSDKTRTVVKCQPGDKFDPELGFLLALCKRVCGNTGIYNELLREHVPGYGGEKTRTEPGIEQMRRELSAFCKRMSCRDCPMGKDGFQCGRGYCFGAPADSYGYITDESIVKHYRAMKGAES